MNVRLYQGPRLCACWRPGAFTIDAGRGDSALVMVLCLRCARALGVGLNEVFGEHREAIVKADTEYEPPPRNGEGQQE